jgi:hypothetical protein
VGYGWGGGLGGEMTQALYAHMNNKRKKNKKKLKSNFMSFVSLGVSIIYIKKIL